MEFQKNYGCYTENRWELEVEIIDLSEMSVKKNNKMAEEILYKGENFSFWNGSKDLDRDWETTIIFLKFHVL